MGLWAPACVQHGFSDDGTFTSGEYRVPSGSGPTLAEAVQEFLDNPAQPKWHLDEMPWPYNAGCNGMRSERRFPLKNLLQE